MVNSRDVPFPAGHLQGFVLAWSHSLLLSACDKLFPLFCKSYTSNTLPFSTFCAWCEICKCSPFAETLPDWQWDTFVVSRWVWHISPLLTIFLTPCRCLLRDVKLLARSSSSWSVSQPWSLQPGQRVRGTTSPRLPFKIHLMQHEASWIQAQHWWLLFYLGGLNSSDTVIGACRDYFFNLIWQILSHCYFF